MALCLLDYFMDKNSKVAVIALYYLDKYLDNNGKTIYSSSLKYERVDLMMTLINLVPEPSFSLSIKVDKEHSKEVESMYIFAVILALIRG